MVILRVIGFAPLVNPITRIDNYTFYAIKSILTAQEEREGFYQELMEGTYYGIIWFNKAGQRVMAETITKDKVTKEATRDRRWYNGYSMP